MTEDTPATPRYVCVHGHFYQPPRENPWLEGIELQDSAYPYHDWNERITAECYWPNARSRILDDEGRIRLIANNYARTSFNIGPTLLKWMQDEAPEVYEAIIAADKESADRFGGHGSAMAQPYNHMIMPLANERDRRTQIIWGIRDFESRYGRRPIGMWLPETAVDVLTLDIMAEHGIEFTVLAPGQANRIKGRSSRNWTDVTGERIDPTRPYYVSLPSGRRINVFFYDGPIARAVAFENVLESGETFGKRLLGAFNEGRQWPQLVHIATDGETYGHHHRFGDMALAYALDYIEREGVAQLINYAQYLALYPPEWQAEIIENTSWSCVHGIERWRSNCGCNTGGNPGWNQEWRAPLREAFDWLRDKVSALYEQKAGELFRDPWQARDAYIDVILNREEASLAAFFKEQGSEALERSRWTEALELLELQRHALLMYTSCGWFFDEISGIEAMQTIQYAGRVIQLAQRALFGDHIEGQFLDLLSRAKSNIPEKGDGAAIYREAVLPAAVDLMKVAAHYAVSSLFEDYPQAARIYCYDIGQREYERQNEGHANFAVGSADVTSVITLESAAASFGVLHIGDHNITAGVRPLPGQADYSEMKTEALAAFREADLPETIRILDRHFGDLTYSLRTLFKDEQRKVLRSVLESTVAEAEANYRAIFTNHAPLMRYLQDIGVPMPAAFQAAAELVVNQNLRKVLDEAPINPVRLKECLDQAQQWSVKLDEQGLAFVAGATLRQIAVQFSERPDAIDLLRSLEESARAVLQLPFAVHRFEVQNRFWNVLQTRYPDYAKRDAKGEADAREWVELFRSVADSIKVRID
jgi:alpha-amylase/alpha-mannosidase (GH57 family)